MYKTSNFSKSLLNSSQELHSKSSTIFQRKYKTFFSNFPKLFDFPDIIWTPEIFLKLSQEFPKKNSPGFFWDNINLPRNVPRKVNPRICLGNASDVLTGFLWVPVRDFPSTVFFFIFFLRNACKVFLGISAWFSYEFLQEFVVDFSTCLYKCFFRNWQ